jgi:hypothetical protein
MTEEMLALKALKAIMATKAVLHGRYPLPLCERALVRHA